MQETLKTKIIFKLKESSKNVFELAIAATFYVTNTVFFQPKFRYLTYM
jgi:hypothetical protein